MSTVTSHAAPKPTIRMPSIRACGVMSGSSSKAFTKPYAARTETANWNRCTRRLYGDGGV